MPANPGRQRPEEGPSDMGNSSVKQPREKIPVVEVTYSNAHEYLVTRLRKHGSKVAQVDAVTGEKVTFDAILERAAALAAGLTARGLRPGDVAVIIGENNIHYPWVLLGILQTGAAAHLVDPRSTPREVEHALEISRPSVALLSSAVSKEDGMLAVLRASPSMQSVMVWGEAAAAPAPDQADLPDGISSLEQMMASPAKSASSATSSPCHDHRIAAPYGYSEVPVVTVHDAGHSLATTPNAPPPTPTSLGATYGDSCSPTPSAGSSPLHKLLVHAVDGLPQPGQGGAAVVLIMPSSGSTGMPKGVMITNDNLLAALELWPTFIRPYDIMAGLSPYFHAFGGLLMLMSLCAGSTVVVISKFSMQGLLDAVEKYRISVMHIVSSLLVSLGKLPPNSLARLATVRRIWSGAAQISPLVQSAFMSRLPDITLHHSYGMTETTFTTFCGESRADKPGSPGTLVRGMECKVVDPDTGCVLPTGTRGELCFRGAMVMRGYLGNAEATSEALDADGWLHSGDLGFVDEDGYYYIIDRLKDVLKYNGHQVSPSELEALLMTHPAVKEAAIVGEEHEYGEAPRALVVLAPGQTTTEKELQCFIAGKVAPHKQLRAGVKFVNAPFPRTASGKLQRKKLRAFLQPDLDESSTTDEAPSPPVQHYHNIPVAPGTPQETRVVVGDISLESSTEQPQVEQCEARHFRPSIPSLSTIYSESPVSTPPISPLDTTYYVNVTDSVRRAAQVPLPPSEPTSPMDQSVFDGSLGSAPMDLASPSSLVTDSPNAQ